jgi:hypothetical protein
LMGFWRQDCRRFAGAGAIYWCDMLLRSEWVKFMQVDG